MFYVYQHKNPNTKEVFYVGKGTGDRINDHEREARRGVCSKKTNKINKIIATMAESRDDEASLPRKIVPMPTMINVPNILAESKINTVLR